MLLLNEVDHQAEEAQCIRDECARRRVGLRTSILSAMRQPEEGSHLKGRLALCNGLFT